MKYSILYTDSKGTSHFKTADISFTATNFAPPAPPVGLSEFMDASKMVFFSIPKGWFGDWHPAPKKQFFCCLMGEAELVAGDGEKRRFRSGDVFLLEDTSGQGHTTRVIGDDAFVAAVVQLANQK
jgi:quercetin dioxygenase-like cupin family protein